MLPTTETNVYQCSVCERKVTTTVLPIYAKCSLIKPRPLVDCAHFGKELNRTECIPCAGVKIKTFSCRLFGEIQISKDLPNVKSCHNCDLKSPL